jgi:hypothetical protein
MRHGWPLALMLCAGLRSRSGGLRFAGRGHRVATLRGYPWSWYGMPSRVCGEAVRDLDGRGGRKSSSASMKQHDL